jgi:hypothetical protein
MSALATNTSTADTRMGIASDVSETISASRQS